VEPQLGIASFNAFISFNNKFQIPKVCNLSITFPPFKILLSLVFKPTEESQMGVPL